MKYIFITIVLLITTLSVAKSEALIYSKDYPNKKLINFGPCFVGDSVHSTFVLFNDGVEPVYIQNGEPTLKVYYSPLDKSMLGNQFRRFDPDMKRQPLPRTLMVSQPNLELPFYFYADTNSVLWPNGVYHAKAMLALAKSGNNEVIIVDTFTLKAKKTDLYIDGFTDSLNFDSVYVNPITPKQQEWLVKSTKMPVVEVSSQEVEIKSPYVGDEFFIDDYKKNPVFNQKFQTIPWNIRYSPLNRGMDSAVFKLYYHPDKNNYPDSTRFASVKLYGIGVEQKLTLLESNYTIKGDTIDVGNIVTGSITYLTGKFNNLGNIPISVVKEGVYVLDSDNSAQIISLSKKAFVAVALPPDEKAIFQINCEPKENGIFIERYEIKTNIKDRNIHGVPASAERYAFYIKGVGVAPQLRLPFDTLDFGSVLINDINCPSTKDTSITITNVGTSNLIVKSISITPNAKFIIPDQTFELKPNATKVLKITFLSDDGEFGPFIAKLDFISNLPSPPKSIILKVNRIPKEKSWLSISKNLKAKPGRLIDVPIVLEDRDYGRHPIKNAKNFQTTITFDSTIMRYDNRQIMGTASEGADVNIVRLSAGSFELYINNKSDYFKPVDTLIKLQFRTYLGEVITTELAFTKSITKFGDGLCNDVLNIDGNIENGSFTVDSVCGLQYKTKMLARAPIIEKIAPNPASGSFELDFTLSRDSECNIEVYDSKGQLISSIVRKGFKAGNNKQSCNISTITTGAYFIKISSVDGSVEKNLMISK